MARLLCDKHFSFPDIRGESYIKANACLAATSDAYDAPVNYRRASGNARDGEHIKSLIYYPVTEIFYSNILYIRNDWTNVITCRKKKIIRILRNYHFFFVPFKLSEEKPGCAPPNVPKYSIFDKSRESKLHL